MSVVGLTHVPVARVQEVAELGEELLLPRDVRGEDQRADQVGELGKLRLGQIFSESTFHKTRDGGSPMMVLEHGDVIVEDRQVAAGADEELLVDAGVVEVVTHGGDQRGEQLHLGQVVHQVHVLTKHVYCLGHVARVYRRVVRIGHVIPSLHNTEKRTKISWIQSKT